MRLATEYPLLRASIRGTAASEGPEGPEVSEVSEAMQRLRAAKGRVPAVVAARGPHGRSAWAAAVDRTADTARSTRPNHRLASRAYHKMGEMWASCALPFPAASLHLCEAPGGFVQWLGDFHPDPAAWEWRAVSLADGPRFQTDLLRTDRGHAETGDVTALVENPALSGRYDLVTADGAADMDHANLEDAHWPLLVAQTKVALRALRPKGTLVVKFFEGGNHDTRRWMASLTTLFEEVSVIKPRSSRPTNSERYLVCRGYAGGGATWTGVKGIVVATAWHRDAQHVLDRLAYEQTRHLQRVLASFASVPQTLPPANINVSSCPPRT